MADGGQGVSWLEETYQQRRARQRSLRGKGEQARAARVQRMREAVRSLDATVRRNLKLVADRTWRKRLIVVGAGFEIRVEDDLAEGARYSWFAFRRGKRRPPCSVYEVYLTFDAEGLPLRMGVGHQRWGRPVSVYYESWEPWQRETESLTEESLRELLKSYYLRGPCLVPPEPPYQAAGAAR